MRLIRPVKLVKFIFSAVLVGLILVGIIFLTRDNFSRDSSIKDAQIYSLSNDQQITKDIKTSFSASEPVRFVISWKNEAPGKKINLKKGSWIKEVFAEEIASPSSLLRDGEKIVAAKVYYAKDNQGINPPSNIAFDVVVEIKSVQSDQYVLSVLRKKILEFRPGKYQLVTTLEKGLEKRDITQDFTWGVLAINTNKSTYQPRETAAIQMAVLDDLGRMDCNASLKLIIKNTQEAEELSIENGKIKVNEECHIYDVNQKPDFEASYQIKESGTYQMELVAITENGTYTINDSFKVEDSPKFNIERIAHTRIYPLKIYLVELKITAHQNFEGVVEEFVPSSFIISELNPLVKSDQSQEGDTKKLSWQVNFKKGQTYTLSYNYDAPDLSPQFYLLGPAKFISDGSGSNPSSIVFSESRPWQVAVDAIKTWLGTTDVNWSVDANWSPSGAPAAIDDIVFSSTGNNPSTVDASFAQTTVHTFSMNATYTNTVTMAKDLIITHDLTLAGGTFNGSSNTLDINEDLSITGGTFNATSGTMTIAAGFSVSNPGVFNHNLGTVTFDSINTNFSWSCNNVVFNLVNLLKGDGNTYTIPITNCNFPLGNNPTFGSTSMGYTYSLTNSTLSGTGTLTITTTVTAGVSLGTGSSLSGFTAISMSEGTFTVSGANFNMADTYSAVTFHNLTVSAGIFTVPTNINLTVDDDFTLSGGVFNTANDAAKTFTVSDRVYILGGVFNGYIGTIDFNSHTTISGGVFNATSGTMTQRVNLTISGSAKFYHNNGTLTFDGNAAAAVDCNYANFNLVVMNKTSGNINAYNCFFPLGASPTVSLGGGQTLTLYNSTLFGSGTLALGSSDQVNLTLNKGAVLNGFTGLTSIWFTTVTVSGADIDFGNYTNFNLEGGFTLSSGTVIAPSGNMDIGMAVTISGGKFIHNNGTVRLTNPGNVNINCGNAVFYNLTQTGFTKTLTSNCNVDNDLAGAFANTSSPYTFYVKGSFYPSGTTWAGSNLTVELTGANNQTITSTATTFASPIKINKTGGVATLGANLTVSTQTCTIASGIFDINGKIFTCAGGFTVQNGGTLRMIGTETPTAPTLDPGSTVSFKGDGDEAADTYTVTAFKTQYSSLAIDSVDTGDIYQLGAAIDMDKDLTINTGTFTVSGSNYGMTIGGNFTNNSTFTQGTGTVTFDTASQPSVLTGSGSPSIIFNNLTIAIGSKIIKFTAGKTFRINGVFTVTGTNKNQTNLVSAIPGTQWIINHQGTESIVYAFIQDAACDGSSTEITLDNTVRSGGNNGDCWVGEAVPKQTRIKGNTRIQGNSRIGAN